MNWQTTHNRGGRFGFIKATEHVSWVDPKFYSNWTDSKAANILPGPYHFYRPEYDPIAQANHFVSTVLESNMPSYLPYVLDVEVAPDSFSKTSSENENYMGLYVDGTDITHTRSLATVSEIASFASDVQLCLNRIGNLTGRLPLIYTGVSFWNTYLRSVLTSTCELFIANWTSRLNPTLPLDWSTWRFWQWTSDGNGPEWGASSARIDLDRFNGNEQDLVAYSLPIPPPPPPPPPVTFNLLPSPGFEHGHYLQDGVPELQIASAPGYVVSFKEGPVTLEDGTVVTFVKPECRVLPREQMPPEEQAIFIWDGDHTVKIFKMYAPTFFTYKAPKVYLPQGQYRLTIPMFVDAIMGYNPDDGSKIYADDPRACRIRPYVNQIINPWQYPSFGQRTSLTCDFNISEPKFVTIGLNAQFRFGLVNNGIFTDAWKLEIRGS